MFVIDSNPNGLTQIKNKFHNWNVEVLQSDNLKCFHKSLLGMDLVFINPSWKTMKTYSNSVGFENLEPRLMELLSQALELTQNIVISLPIYIHLNEIAKIMKDLSDKKLM